MEKLKPSSGLQNFSAKRHPTADKQGLNVGNSAQRFYELSIGALAQAICRVTDRGIASFDNINTG
jgi:hypothetical protein